MSSISLPLPKKLKIKAGIGAVSIPRRISSTILSSSQRLHDAALSVPSSQLKKDGTLTPEQISICEEGYKEAGEGVEPS